MATATPSFPTSLADYLSKLKTACNDSPTLEQAESQRLVDSFHRLRDLAAEQKSNASESRQIAEAMRQVIAVHPRTWMAFEASRVLSQIQPAVRP